MVVLEAVSMILQEKQEKARLLFKRDVCGAYDARQCESCVACDYWYDLRDL